MVKSLVLAQRRSRLIRALHLLLAPNTTFKLQQLPLMMQLVIPMQALVIQPAFRLQLSMLLQQVQEIAVILKSEDHQDLQQALAALTL